MQGELAQLISLTSYGNEYLNTEIVPHSYFPDHSTFKFCHKVDFIIPKKNRADQIIWAENPLAWFEKLKEAGCQQLRLYYQPATRHPLAQEHQLVGFVGGGGQWLLEAEMVDHIEYWLKNWSILNKNDPERKIWTVHYLRIEANTPFPPRPDDAEKVKSEFKTVLIDLIHFCHAQNLSNWGAVFERGSTILSGSEPIERQPQADLLVSKNYSLTAQQLLYAAEASWVFGGMGSWNDIGFDDADVQKAYDRLSEKLYAMIIKGIVAAMNYNIKG